MLVYRIIFAVLFLAQILLSFFSRDFLLVSLVRNSPLLIVSLFFLLFIDKFMAWCLKLNIKALNKRGKVAFSPESVIEFHEDHFIESTAENRNEMKYSIIERVSVISGKIIYIHIDTARAYLLPMSCFESKEQYDDFMNFISTKCPSIDLY